jgi:phenylpyruvate tautomerase PptA (4-oxalocrotonate tautomerase family)
MPLYACTSTLGRLTPAQKTEIAGTITTIYHEETGAPGYLVQVIFYDIAPGNHYLAGRPAPEDEICIRCDTRSGKTSIEKSQMLRRITQGVARVSGVPEDAVSVLLCELPLANMAEYGRNAPAPGEEDAWFSSLPDALQARLKALS